MTTLSSGLNYQDEAGVIAVPPAEGWDTDLRVEVLMQYLTAIVSVTTQNEAGLEPPQELLLKKTISVHLMFIYCKFLIILFKNSLIYSVCNA